jgi:hypothetical protein
VLHRGIPARVESGFQNRVSRIIVVPLQYKYLLNPCKSRSFLYDINKYHQFFTLMPVCGKDTDCASQVWHALHATAVS